MNKQELALANLLEANTFYSKYFKELIEELKMNPELKDRRFELESEEVVDFMRDYDSEVNAWPVFINQSIVASFTRFIELFPGAIYKAFDIFHRAAPKEFEEYLGFNAFGLMKSAPFTSKDLLMRYDLVFSKGVFKVVEVNSGSSIGGWQLDWLHDNFMSTIGCLESASKWNIKYTNITRALMFSAVQSMARLTCADKTGNLLVLDSDGSRDQNSRFHQVVTHVFNEVKRSQSLSGDIYFISTLQDIDFRPDGKLIFDNHVIDGLLLSMPLDLIPKDLTMRLTISFLGGKLAYPDSPFHGLAGNKLALALLHDPRIKSELSAIENEMIENHIPWGGRVSQEEFSWGGKTYTSEQFFREFKDDVVLKKARSFQGKDVVVGRFSSQEEWDEMLQLAMTGGDWLVQEYCEPDAVVVCDDDIGIAAFDLVWGVFHLADRYGGSFVRGVPNAKLMDSSYNGVINSHQGAKEFSVFEERDDL